MSYFIIFFLIISQLLLFCLIYQQQLVVSHLTENIFLQNEISKNLKITVEKVNSLVDKNHTEFLNCNIAVDTIPQTTNTFFMVVLYFLLVGSLYILSAQKTDLLILENLLDKPVDISPQFANLIEISSKDIIAAVETSNVDGHVKIFANTEKAIELLNLFINPPN